MLFGRAEPPSDPPLTPPSTLPSKNPTKELRYSDIFIAGGFPIHTYNPRLSFKLEERISQVLHNLCQLVIVTGSTKSGKTTLVENILPRTNAVWIEGGSVGNEDDLWRLVLDQLELFDTITVDKSDESTSERSSTLSAEVNALIGKGGTEIETLSGKSVGNTLSASRNLSPKVAAISGLTKRAVPIVIDDFHYLPKSLQESVIHALKSLIYRGLPVVIIAIPHHRYDAIKVEREMTGRFLPVGIPPWSEDELMYIPNTGFTLLSSTLDLSLTKKLAAESIGSPHLMQNFCRNICTVKGLITKNDGRNLILTNDELNEIFMDIADSIGRPIFDKLARGPRQRSDRIPRKLKSGKYVDIYGVVLHALAHIKPDITSLEYEQLRFAIRDILDDQLPTIQEVARVLKHMSEIAATDRSSTPVLEFDEEEKLLHITDPFFAFYLRWGRIN